MNNKLFGIIEHVMDTGSGGRQHQTSSTKENKQKESEKKSTSHTDSSSAVVKDDVSDIVSQTKSGSAPASVISSAQSMDPTKKDSASGDAYFVVKYNNLLANIAEVGRDVKPAYTNNKSSSERLRKNIVITRNTIRDLILICNGMERR